MDNGFSPVLVDSVPEIVAQTTNSDHIGSYQYTLVSYSDTYPELELERSLEIIVQSCVITQFSQ